MMTSRQDSESELNNGDNQTTAPLLLSVHLAVRLHCHILPCVDDGAQSLEEAMKMARFYVADGVSCVVANPSLHRFYSLLRHKIIPAVATTQS